MMRRCFILGTLLCLVISPLQAQGESQEQELLSVAQQAFSDGFSDVAIRYLEEFLQKFPQSPKINSSKLLLGQAYYLQGQYEKSLVLFLELKGQSENRDAILFWLGEIYLKQGKGEEAHSYYQSVIEDFPLSALVPQAYYSLGWVHFEAKDFDKAKGYFDALSSKFPFNQFSEDAVLKSAECEYNAGRLSLAVKAFQSYLQKYPHSKNACMINYNTAESLYYLDRFEEALNMYQKVAVGMCGEELLLASNMGIVWAYTKLKKFSEAKGALQHIKLPPDELALMAAQLVYEQGQYEQAIKLFSDFISQYPQSPKLAESYLTRANIYFLLKQFDKAMSDYQRVAQEKDAELFEKATFGLGWSQVKLGQLPQAVKYFESVIEKTQDPQTKANALLQIADAYQDNGQLEEAITAYEKAAEQYPDNPMADYVLYRQAIALLKAEKISEALVVFEDLRARFASSKYLEDIDYYRAVASFKNGDWPSAVVTMENFLKSLLAPSEFTPEANYILALSYLNLKRIDDALRVFQKILRLYPEDINVAKNADIGIAKCFFELGQVKEALKRFKLIVYKYPKTDVEGEALLWLAQYYLKNAQYADAIDFYLSLIERFPDNPQIDQLYYELAQSYEIQGQADKAIEQYKKISSRDGNLISKAKLAIAGILSKELDPQRAINAYESIISTNPQFASDAYLRLGQLYRNAQDYEKEIDVYQKALKSKDDKGHKAQLQFNIADTLELMSRTDEAIEHYLIIPQSYSSELAWVVKAYFRVAKIYEVSKDWQGAAVVYQKIIQLNTDEVKYAQERLEWIKNNAVSKK